jgi:hypothetical protein
VIGASKLLDRLLEGVDRQALAAPRKAGHRGAISGYL